MRRVSHVVPRMVAMALDPCRVDPRHLGVVDMRLEWGWEGVCLSSHTFVRDGWWNAPHSHRTSEVVAPVPVVVSRRPTTYVRCFVVVVDFFEGLDGCTGVDILVHVCMGPMNGVDASLQVCVWVGGILAPCRCGFHVVEDETVVCSFSFVPIAREEARREKRKGGGRCGREYTHPGCSFRGGRMGM